MNKKYQIFISSTFIDLIEQREQVQKSILKMGHLPVGMEMFNAADDTQWEVIKRHIDNSDYYVVIIANRYGSTDKDGISYTEKEYDYAKSIGIPCLAFVIDESVLWTPKHVEKGGAAKKGLEKFKQKVKGTLVNQWSTTEQLAIQVMMSLTETITIKPGRGWVRADEGAASPQVLEEIARLSKENNELKFLVNQQSNKLDEIAEAKNILENILVGTSEERETFGEINLLDVFSELGNLIISPIASRSLLIQSQAATAALGFNQHSNTWIEKRIILPLLENLSILNITEKSIKQSSNGEHNVYWLTTKGKKLLASLKY